MKLRSILALLLAVSFLLVLTAACDSGSTDTPAGPAQPGQTPGEPGEETPGGGVMIDEDGRPVYVPPSYDFPDKDADVIRYKDGRRHIIIGGAYDRYYDSTHNDIFDNPSVSNPETSQMSLDNVRRIEEKYNVYIEFVNMTWEGIMENIPISIMSGIPDADVYYVDAQISIPAVLNGMAVALEDIGIDGKGAEVFNPGGNIVMRSLKIPGQDKTYLFTGAGYNQGMYMIGYNKEMIGTHGLTDPQELWDRDEWNWETFREYCRVLTNPAQDIYGWSGYWTNFLTGLLFSNNATFASGPVQTLDSPNTLETLNFIHELYNVDRTARPWDTSDWTINNNLYAEGKSGFWISTTWLNNEQGGENLPFELGMVPFPIGPQGSKDTMPTENGAEGGFYFIPRYIQDPKLVYDVIYELTNWFQDDLEYRDDMDWARDSVVTEENYHYYIEVNGRVGFDLLHVLGVAPSLEQMLENFDQPPQYTPAQYAETFKQVFQDALNNYFR